MPEQPSQQGEEDDGQLMWRVVDELRQELASAVMYVGMLEPSEASEGLEFRLSRAQDRLQLLLRHSEDGLQQRKGAEPAVVADLLTDFARSQPNVDLELKYVMDAPLVLAGPIREVLFLFLRGALQDLAENAPGGAVRMLVELADGAMTCSVTHELDRTVATAGIPERLEGIGGRLSERAGYSAISVSAN